MNSPIRKKSNNFNTSGSILRKKRFLPFLITMCFGSANDNIFKNALIIIIAFKAGAQLAIQPDVLINIAAGLLIAPYLFFSATAGQLADKFEKSFLIKTIKLVEIAIMVVALFAFLSNSIYLLLFLLFLMGTQSAFFGPVKYSIMPVHLKKNEIVTGNAIVEMATFIAILAGTITGGLLAKIQHANMIIPVVLILMAIVGYFASRFIPYAKAASPNLKINLNIFAETIKIVKMAKQNRTVFLSILAISWFWLIGAAYLTQLPQYTKQYLNGNETVVTFLLASISVGIGLGSILCEKLSNKKIELGLVPIGSIGLAVFSLDLAFFNEMSKTSALIGLQQFLRIPESYRVIIDFFMIGVFGGIFAVPLYTIMQVKSDEKVRSRIIAVNNIMNALFMIAASGLAILCISVFNLSIGRFFLVLAILHIIVSIYIYTVIPEWVMRLVMWVITRAIYRVRSINIDNIPESGGAILICNHITYIDALIIAGSVNRPIHFIMDNEYFDMPIIKNIFNQAKVIPIAAKHENMKVYEESFEKISEYLRDGDLVCIFPEGRLTRDGKVDTFKPGIDKIISRDPVPVVPMVLRNLWGSWFSRCINGRALKGWPRKLFAKVELEAEKAIQPSLVTAQYLEFIVKRMYGK